MVHEGDTIAPFVIGWVERIALVFEPLDLVTSNAVHSTTTEAISTTSSKEPKTRINMTRINGVFYTDLVSELMVHLFAVVLVKVGKCGSEFLLLLKIKHCLLANIGLKVVISWHNSPRCIEDNQSLSQDVVMFLPEISFL